MAQAPDAGGGGAPRQNKTVKQFSGMNTQNQRNAVPEGQFPWLENIQPIGPGNLHSIPGRGLSVTRIPPSTPTSCPDSAPGPQDLPVVCCYDSNAFGDLSDNNAGMFAHADDDGSFWHTASQMTGFGSGPYPFATPTQTWYLLEPINPDPDASPLDCGLQEATPLDLPGGRTADFQSTQTPQAGTCGKSDSKCYELALININPPFSIGVDVFTTSNTFFDADDGVSFLRYSGAVGIFSNAWCKFADHVYIPVKTDICRMASWPVPAPTGTYEDAQVNMPIVLNGWDEGTMNLENILMIHATTGFLYVLARGAWDAGPSQYRIFKVDRSTMNYVSHWVLTGDPFFPNPWGIHAFSDELIFLIGPDLAGSPAGDWAIGNFHTATGTTEVIDGGIPGGCTPAGNPVGAAGQSGFYYAMNYFYLSYSGFGLGVTNVLKLGPLVCPSNPSIPWQS